MKATENSVVIDFGYASLILPNRWMAIAGRTEDFQIVRFVREEATVQISFFTSSKNTIENDLETLYRQIIQLGKTKGFHVDDLADETDNEIIVGEDSEDARFAFTHYFLRSAGESIIVAAMRGHDQSDEETIRNVMDNLIPGSLQAHPDYETDQYLKPLEPVINVEEWDQLMDDYIITGGK